MKEIRVRHQNGKFNGTYLSYQIGDTNCPPLTNKLFASENDWIADDNGIVAQILRIRTVKGKLRTRINITTCFGADTLRVIYQESRSSFPTLDFNRKRPFWSSCHKKNKLTVNNLLFLQLVAQTENVLRSYRIVTDNKDAHLKDAKQTLRFLLELEEGRRYFKQMLSEEAKERGLDQEKYYLDKLEDAVGGGIKNELHLRILKILSVAGGNPEVIKMLQENLDAGDRPMFPVDGRLEKAEEVKALPEETEQLKT